MKRLGERALTQKEKDARRNKDRRYASRKAHRLANLELYRARGRMKYKRGKEKNPKRIWFQSCKDGAKKRGLVFTLNIEDVIVPKICPVLGIPLEFHNDGKLHPNTPTFDRLNNDKGYTPDNVKVISWRANKYKSDMSTETLRKLLKYAENT